MENAQNKETRIRIELTNEQRERIKQQSGEDVTVLEFTAQELEQRIAPIIINW
jgi:hypothetical protein